jgi:hypothetical protein
MKKIIITSYPKLVCMFIVAVWNLNQAYAQPASGVIKLPFVEKLYMT